MTVLEPVAEAVIAAYRNNKSMKSIAAVYDCSIGTVRNLLIAKGEARRSKGRPKNTAEAV
jgi:transposase